MSYELSNPAMRETYERYKGDHEALHDMAADIALLRTLVQSTVEANADNPGVALKAVETGLSTLIKLERRLAELDILRNQVLNKTAIAKLGQQIIIILADALNRLAPDMKNQIVDEVAPRLASAIVDARNEDDE
ncbi:hypothetical protein [Botrimarina mediterranea]|uniref:Uncharacterized protein n=1 Tax=Botrimarina mediterranea TaxID=2528022 RepID=A0A518K5K3_9BACT|nr:hypothetical protein [Botrimarina mediterranea]QDV73074.1 hypothetical protein Spa11_12630 [Botrimarina mediterranea]